MKQIFAAVAALLVGGIAAGGAAFGIATAQNPDVMPGSQTTADGRPLTSSKPLWVGYETWNEG